MKGREKSEVGVRFKVRRMLETMGEFLENAGTAWRPPMSRQALYQQGPD